jgi:hypothetical protein
MDKLKSLGSKIKFPSTPGEKLSKAFKFDRKHNVLSKPNDPFMDAPMLEDVRSTFMEGCQQVIKLIYVAIITENTFLYSLRMCMSPLSVGTLRVS